MGRANVWIKRLPLAQEACRTLQNGRVRHVTWLEAQLMQSGSPDGHWGTFILTLGTEA